jgi:hypothetical protein
MGKQVKRQKKTLEDKIRDYDSSFVDEVLAASDDSLKDRLMRLAAADENLEVARGDDEDLKSKKAEYDTAAETYSVPIKANKLKRKLIIQILSRRGKV